MSRLEWTLIIVATLAIGHVQVQADEDRIEALEARIEQLESAGGPGIPLHLSWHNGPRMRSDDGSIQFNLSGRVQYDFAGFDADSELSEVAEFDSGTQFRRGRIALGGVMHEHTIFNVEYEFAGGDAKFLTTFIGVRNIPFLGTVRVGRLLEFYSLEQLSSNNFHTFMERGLSAAFNNYWANGIGIHNSVFEGRGSWAVGAAKRTDNYGNSQAGRGENLSARITAAPVYLDNGRTWVHLGAATIQRNPDDNEYRVGSRPESSIAPTLISTGPVPSDRVNLVGLEFAAAHGPFSVQAEWHNARVSLEATDEFPHDGHANLNGFYVLASYFLTGETRSYNPATGTLGIIRPNHNFRGDGHGLGAWEIAARYSELDLNDGPVEGGHLRNGTLGLNWYLNPTMRVMANYVRADLKESGTADILQMRAQFTF